MFAVFRAIGYFLKMTITLEVTKILISTNELACKLYGGSETKKLDAIDKTIASMIGKS